MANAVSITGDGVTVTAGPLLAASITRDPLLVAGALFAQQLPWLIFALFSGVLVDRLDPARLMVLVNLLRAAVIGGLAASVLAGTAHLAALYGALFILGVGSTVSDTAALSLPPLLVGPDDLVRANAGLTGVQLVGGDLVGPPLGAYLFVLAAGLPFAFDAATFVVARGFGLTAPFWVAAVAIGLVAMLAWRLFTPGRLTAEPSASRAGLGPRPAV